ncbi:MAG: hypothetical protein ABGY75_12025, partial [Gemmataceae bacterium]
VRPLLAGIVVASALAAGCGKAKPTASGTGGPIPPGGATTAPPPSNEVSWSGTAVELSKELAKGSYNFVTPRQGKWVVMSGTLQGVTTPMEPGFRTRQLRLVAEGRDPLVLTLPVTATPPGKLTAGQTVKLKGVLRDYDAAGVVMTLSDVEILEAGPVKALQTTAEEILKACQDGTALEKYKGVNAVILTGTVDEVGNSKGLPVKVLVFKGKDGWTLECTLASGTKPDAVPKAGQAVKLVGSGVSPDTGRKIASVSFCEVIAQ